MKNSGSRATREKFLVYCEAGGWIDDGKNMPADVEETSSSWPIPTHKKLAQNSRKKNSAFAQMERKMLAFLCAVCSVPFTFFRPPQPTPATHGKRSLQRRTNTNKQRIPPTPQTSSAHTLLGFSEDAFARRKMSTRRNVFQCQGEACVCV